MTTGGKIDSQRIILSDLFEKFWFVIPNYQRHYVWKDDNVIALLEDVKEHHENNIHKKDTEKDEFFLGALVLKKHKNTNDYDVLDGQQRLTTLLLIFSVIRDLTNNYEDIDNLLKQAKKPSKRIYNDKNRIVFDIRDNIKDFPKDYMFFSSLKIIVCLNIFLRFLGIFLLLISFHSML